MRKPVKTFDKTLRPKLLDSLYLYASSDRILYLNPALPDWISINRKYKGIFDRFNGHYSVNSILDYVSKAFSNDNVNLLNNQIIKIVNNINIFTHSTVKSARQINNKPIPRYIYLTLTDTCNLKCSYCYTADRQKVFSPASPSLPLSFSHWKGFIDQIIAYSDIPLDFNFTGGEPLLVPYIFSLAKHIRESGSRSVLLSNGILIQDKKTARKVASHFHQVRLSLDSVDEVANSHLRGAGVVEKVKRAFILLEQCGADVIVVSTVTKLNREHLKVFAEEFKHKVSFQPLYRIGRGRISPFSLSGVEYFKALGSAGILKKLPSFHQNIHHYRNNPYKRCAMAAEELSIGPDGNLFPCHLLHYSELKTGNLQQASFSDLYENSPILQELRRINVDTLEQCRTCPVRNFCGAACRARIDYLRKGLKGKDGFCIYEKRLILDALLHSYG